MRLLAYVYGIAVIFLIICMAWLTSGCQYVKYKPWTKDDIKTGIAFGVAHTANWYSTHRHQQYPVQFYERNIILGRHPSQEKIAVYFALTGIGAYFVAHYIPPLRRWLLGSYACINTRYAINDLKLVRDGR